MNLLLLCALVFAQPAQIISDNNYATTIQFILPNYTIESVVYDGKVYNKVVIPNEVTYLEKGFPELPRLYKSIITNDVDEYDFHILNAVYETLAVKTILPSKGNLSREIDPEKVPYEFSSFYNENRWFPENQIDIAKPFIMHDYRGLTIHFNPFQYNPVTGQLIVCRNITIEVYRSGKQGINIKTRKQNAITISREFKDIYQDFFINFSPSRFDSVLERAGRMLIITTNSYYNNILPLATWKRMKGIPTKIAKYPDDIGSGTTAIKTYIQTEYNAGNLVWILIVGDAGDIPPAMGIGVPVIDVADPVYTYLEGGDYYPDAFISRFSANSPQDVDNQVARTITYERTLITGNGWESKGMGVASNISGGTPPYYDSTRCNWLRDMLLGYNYTSVDRIYDPYGTIAMVSTGLNEGRSIANYIGHGSMTAWSSTGFSNSNVNQLTNYNKLPYIISVACYNGQFDDGTCFGEAWLRAGTPANPAGAIAFYGSSISQSWVPPTVSQSAACSLLVHDRMHTIGGIMFNGSCHMIAAYEPGTDGLQEFENWHIFGDASVPVRTLPPQAITVNHQATFFLGLNSINILVPGVSDALVGIYKDTLLYGSGYTNSSGNVLINFIQPVTTFGYLHITVTAYNKATYFDSIPVVPASYPYIITGLRTIIDSGANGQINPGEYVDYGIWAHNVGVGTAQGVYGIITTTDSFVSVINDSSWYGNIPANDSSYSSSLYRFRIANNCPDNHLINMLMTFHDVNDSMFQSYQTFRVYAPILSFRNVSILGGNNNGIFNRGETVNMVVTLNNIGGANTNNVTATLLVNDPHITMIDSWGSFGVISAGDSATNTLDPFTVASDTLIIPGTMIQFQMAVNHSFYSDTFEFSIPVEIYLANFEEDNGNYIADPATSAWEWGVPTSGPSSAHSGTKLWATVLGGQYTNNANWKLTSPELTATGNNPQLKFWHWYNMEMTSTIYDGGNVKISTDNGLNWAVVTPVGGYTGTCTNNTPGVGGQQVFSGINESWNEVTFNLPVNAGQRFLLRWHFGSDIGVTRSGWYVDDITGIGFAILPTPNNDVGVNAIIAPTTMHRVSTVMQPIARIKNFGTLNQTSVPVICSIFGTGNVLRYSNSQTVATLNSGDTARVSFDAWTPPTTEQITVKMRTNLVGDQVPGNDMMSRTCSISLIFISESFEDVTFPPTGWQSIIVNGTYNWERKTSNTNPACVPYEGTAMASYQSYSASAGSMARLISPAIALGPNAIPCSLKFCMYHDPGYSSNPDSVKVEYSLDGTTFTRVAAFRRYEVPAAWTEHTVYIGTFSGTIYVGLLAYSGYGDNMNIDNVRLVAGLAGIAQNSVNELIVTALNGVKPNPVTNGLAQISFSLAEPGRVALKIYDASGRVVTSLVNAQLARGRYNMTWNGKDEHNRNVADGIYFYTLETSKQNFTKKMVYTR